MWIEKLDNGKYKYVERYTDTLSGNQRKVSFTHEKKNSRVEKEMFIKLQNKIKENLNKSSANINFKTLTEKWLAIFEKQVRASTFNNNLSYMIIINKEIGAILLEKLKVAHINSVILHLFDMNYGYDTVRGMVSSVRSIINFGLKYGYLTDRELLHGIELPKINVSQKDDFKYLERDELSMIVNQLQKKGYGELARMCLIQTNTGMRYGELISLDYTKHIDFKEQTILVERTWYHQKKVFQLTKDGKPRTIHFNNETAQLLKDQIQHTKLKVMQNGFDKSQHLIFINYHNEPFTNSYANELLGKHVKIPNKHVTTHIFRHTFISLMVERGTELSLIAKHVGHADTSMIEKVYAHFTKKMNKDLKDAIDDFSIYL